MAGGGTLAGNTCMHKVEIIVCPLHIQSTARRHVHSQHPSKTPAVPLCACRMCSATSAESAHPHDVVRRDAQVAQPWAGLHHTHLQQEGAHHTKRAIGPQ